MNLTEIEHRRSLAQAGIDRAQGARRRNQTGQFSTPLPLARSIVRTALQYVSEERIQLLEPAVGTGAFFSALLHEEIRPTRALGFEINPELASVAEDLWHEYGLEVRSEDFTRSTPSFKANLIITNPPYVRHHHLSQEDKARLKAAVAGVAPDLNGLAGLHTYFIVLSERWLGEDGVAVWLLPSEWMDVGYGEAVRRFLTTRVTLERLHVFDASSVQFGDALVSSSVVVLRKRRPQGSDEVTVTRGALEDPAHVAHVSVAELRSERRWSRLAVDGLTDSSKASILGQLVDVKRGIATGANSFFIRSLSEFESLGFPKSVLRPILPSSRSLAIDVVEGDPTGYPLVDEPLALLDCTLPWAEVEARYPEVARLLSSPEGQRASNTYLASRRRPWYSQEQRPVPGLFCTYMGRKTNGTSPFRVILNRSAAVATNTYLLLYAKGPLLSAWKRRTETAEVFSLLLRQTIAEHYLRHSRVYGGGLHKLEPGELASLPADRIWDELRLDQFEELLRI